MHTHKHTAVETQRNPHDQLGRPGDTQSVGDEEMDMVGVEGERQNEKGFMRKKGVKRNMRADLVLR